MAVSNSPLLKILLAIALLQQSFAQESSSNSTDNSTSSDGLSIDSVIVNKAATTLENPVQDIFPFNVIDEQTQYVRIEDAEQPQDAILKEWNDDGLDFIHDPEVTTSENKNPVFPANTIDRYFEVEDEEEYGDNKLVYVWSGQAVFNLDPVISDEIDERFWDIMKTSATIVVEEGDDYWTELCAAKFSMQGTAFDNSQYGAVSAWEATSTGANDRKFYDYWHLYEVSMPNNYQSTYNDDKTPLMGYLWTQMPHAYSSRYDDKTANYWFYSK